MSDPSSATPPDHTPPASTPTDRGPDAVDRRELKVGMISLGCPKNLVDSEVILGNAGAAGLRLTTRPEDADILVVNTCSFIESAREESIHTILEACELKRSPDGPRKVVVTGCMAQRYGEELRTEIPEVDAIVGLGEYDAIGDLILDLMGGSERFYRVSDPDFACQAETGRLRLTPPHLAYVRISEGCDNPCTFCAIPAIRGRFRSKPLARIEDEVRELVDGGTQEIVIVSQDTTSYGVDLDGTFQLPRLLERIASIPGVRWIRLLYAYPTCFSNAMIDAVASIPQVVKYVDMPLQHISDNMLRRMGRRSNEASTRRLLTTMRERIPGLYLRTTFIVGFPGEDDQEFGVLRDFVEEFEFERLGVFTYSPEDGTPAFRMKDGVPPEISGSRRHELMMTQQEIAFRQNRSRRGERTRVLIDGHNGLEWLARSHGEAPEIDPIVLIPDPGARAAKRAGQASTAPARGFVEIADLTAARRFRSLGVGRMVDVEITGARGYDLVAEPVS